MGAYCPKYMVYRHCINNVKMYVPWQITPASDLCVHAVRSVVAKEQLNREVSEPVQVTPCKYIGFTFSVKPPLAAMAPEIQSVHTLLTVSCIRQELICHYNNYKTLTVLI